MQPTLNDLVKLDHMSSFMGSHALYDLKKEHSMLKLSFRGVIGIVSNLLRNLKYVSNFK